MYAVLRSSEFFERYKKELTPGEFKFITKAYRTSDDSVAVYLKENEYDCYFQLPCYQSNTLPENRKDIFLLRKNTLRDVSGLEEISGGRLKVPIKLLEVWRNPYKESDNIIKTTPITKEVIEVMIPDEPTKETRADKIKRLSLEINERTHNLELIIERLNVLTEKALESEKNLIQALEMINYAENTS